MTSRIFCVFGIDRNPRSQGARYRLLDHDPEGRTDVVSVLRDYPLSQAPKCMVMMVKRGKKITIYVLEVLGFLGEVPLILRWLVMGVNSKRWSERAAAAASVVA